MNKKVINGIGHNLIYTGIKIKEKLLILGSFFENSCANEVEAWKILLSHEPVYGLPWCLNIHGHDHSDIEPYKDGCYVIYY